MYEISAREEEHLLISVPFLELKAVEHRDPPDNYAAKCRDTRHPCFHFDTDEPAASSTLLARADPRPGGTDKGPGYTPEQCINCRYRTHKLSCYDQKGIILHEDTRSGVMLHIKRSQQQMRDLYCALVRSSEALPHNPNENE